MGVLLRRLAVRRPAGMADPGGSVQPFAVHRLHEVRQLAHASADVDLPVAEHGQTGRIVAAVLKRLEYRGYDSAGLAVLRDGKIDVRRSVGKLANLVKAVNGAGLNGTAGIGHTRWATHGKPSEQNAHPHRSGPLVLVHNGIIENYGALKARLQEEGYRSESETDTEVMAHLIARHLKHGRGVEGAAGAAAKEVRGSSPDA